jgi:hypothetical protein
MNFTEEPSGVWMLKVLATTAVVGLIMSLLLLWFPVAALVLVCTAAIVVGIARNEDYLDYEPDLGILSFL